MKSQVLHLAEMGIIDTSFIALDSTPIYANTSHNNPKSFKKNKFSKDNQPKADKGCGLGVHTLCENPFLPVLAMLSGKQDRSRFSKSLS